MSLRDFLARHDLLPYLAAFEEQQVTIADLAELSDEDLRSTLGMYRLIDRKRLKAAIAALNTAEAASSMGGALSGPTRFQLPTQPTPTYRTPLSGPTPIGVVPSSLTPSLSGFTSEEQASALPTRLGSYRVLGVLGTGGMGTVVRARHAEEGWAARQGGDVAIKLIHPHIAADPLFRERFFAEADMGRRVQHPSLVPTWDVVLEGPWLGTVMSYVAGQPLSTQIRTGGLPVDAVTLLLGPLAEALDHLHSHNIVHRDLKPANVVVRADGRPIVLDLGIAKDASALESHTRTMTPLGTSAWMAPEQADAKRVDGAADRYSLGLIAYALLTGQMPWSAGESEARMLVNKLTGHLLPLRDLRTDVAAGVSAAVMRMISLAPEGRYATCAQFVTALVEAEREAVAGKLAAQAKREAEAKAQREAAAKAQREAEAKAQREAAEKAQREAAAKAQREAEAKAQREAEAKAQRDAAAKAQREVEGKAQREAAARVQREAEAKAKREAAEKAQWEAEAKARREAAEKAQRESAAYWQREAAEKAQREAAEKAQREAEAKARREAALQAQQDAAAQAEWQAAAQAQQDAAAHAQWDAGAATVVQRTPRPPRQKSASRMPLLVGLGLGLGVLALLATAAAQFLGAPPAVSDAQGEVTESATISAVPDLPSAAIAPPTAPPTAPPAAPPSAQVIAPSNAPSSVALPPAAPVPTKPEAKPSNAGQKLPPAAMLEASAEPWGDSQRSVDVTAKSPPAKGTVSVFGDIQSATLIGSDGSKHAPGLLPVGTYAVKVTFPTGVTISGSVVVSAGKTKAISCSSQMQRCGGWAGAL